tara:strand:+ start:15794 stop:17878 length:2085 start_codon:yes stop_codon:yes gene_type:complete
MKISSVLAVSTCVFYTDISLAAESLALEEVVVTARKRAESLLDAPIAISAFSEQRLEQLGVNSMVDMKNYIPNLHYSDRGSLQTEITIRGVGGNSRNIGVDSGVGMYVDGVYTGRTGAYNQSILDVERIEVLRGPQGTLFGKNTTGGAINIISKKPTEEFYGQVKGNFGNYDEKRGRVFVSGPITDSFFGNIVVDKWDRDGYLDNIAPEPRLQDELQSEDRLSGRVHLRSLLTDKLELNLAVDATRDRRDAVLNQNPNYDRMEVSTDQLNINDRDMWGVSFTIDYNVNENWDITAITGYRDTDIFVKSDADQTPVDIFHSEKFTDETENFSQEIRAAFSYYDFSGVAGLYYYSQDSAAFRYIFFMGNPFLNDHELEVRSYAAFTNVTYDIRDDLALTLGARYTKEKRDGKFYQESDFFPSYDFPSIETDDGVVSWTANLNYKWNEFTSTYISASHGFKSGGMSLDTLTVPFQTAESQIFDPEYVTTYELGFKSDFWDDRAQAAIAVFYSEYEDRQVTQFVRVPGGAFETPQTTNAGESEISGIEIELQARLTEGLTLWGNAAFMDGEYTEFPNATSTGLSFTGNTTERTPKSSGSLGLIYRYPLGDGFIALNGDINYKGETELQADNFPRHLEDGYTVYNARIGYEMANGFGMYVWGKNLSDEEYLEFSRDFLDSRQILYGEPRMYGVEVMWNF